MLSGKIMLKLRIDAQTSCPTAEVENKCGIFVPNMLSIVSGRSCFKITM
jgi:hypothetical protein